MISKSLRFTALAAALVPTAAFAHIPQSGGGLAAGMLHPLTGADHLVVTVLVGAWSAWAMRRHASPMALIPAGTFVGALLAGMGAADTLLAGMVEPLILLSLIVLGIAIAVRANPPIAIAAPVFGIFGLIHGMAHGWGLTGVTDQAAAAWFAAGLIAASLGLLGLGAAMVRWLPENGLRCVGAAGACLGLLLAGAG